tara:strand:+ start:281 stop:391 length:111 start_codon:yes stop_codon:yes gene_type:complete
LKYLKIIGKWVLRVVLASAVVVAGDVGLYYLWVFVF